MPVLAAEIPSAQNGGVSRDGTAVTWTIKKGVSWHDGTPLTAADVVFTWEYAADPATAATTLGIYRDLERVEKVGEHSVKVVFKQPNPFWAEPFCGSGGTVIPRHVFGAYRGARSREAPANIKPVGTGPYRLVDFKPGDTVRAELHPGYHVANRPFFDSVEMKGGGDAVSAARAVLQTGEYDFAWNVQVEDDILKRLEQGGKGRVLISPSSSPEHLRLNFSDPWREVDGERSSAKTSHPLLSDPAVRAALGLLVDRAGIQEQIYGRGGQATANFLNTPARFRSANTRWEHSVDRANQALEAAGWKRGADGVRAREGKRLKLLFQTSINATRQKTQAIVKQAAARAGIEMELKSVVASVFFSSDPANPDTSLALLRRSADVRDLHGPSGSPALHGAVHVLADRAEGQQMGARQQYPVEERRVRPALEGGRAGDGRRQASGAVHPHERHGRARGRRDPHRLAQRGHRGDASAPRRRDHALGLRPLESRLLAPAGVR